MRAFCIDQSLTIILMNIYTLEWLVSRKLYQVMHVSFQLHILYEICQCLTFVYHRSFNVKKEAFRSQCLSSSLKAPKLSIPRGYIGMKSRSTLQNTYVEVFLYLSYTKT